MLKSFAIIISFLLLIIIGLLLWNAVSAPINPQDKTTHDFLVTRGQSLSHVASNLEKQGLIKNRTVFKWFTQISGQAGRIQAGEYSLSPSYSLNQIMTTLVLGPKELWVTFPEGLRREEMAVKVIKTLSLDDERAEKFYGEFLTLTADQEGYLFPETYLFGKDVSANTVVQKLASTFDAKITDQMKNDAKKSTLTFSELLILASVVERETRTDEERAIVAGILLKRINAKMPLQVDATLQYIAANKKCGIGYSGAKSCTWWAVPGADDRSIKSAYNTYLNHGLPPQPIANPSLSSLRAAIYPEDSPYWFYLHDSKGMIHYAKDGSEHQKNIEKYLK
ncbi:MAG: endolytic transglycosylase MltG [Candidatus Blackburnbacteria bacterium]|nr:endolytic transglycosylase MltG [Candidatus Blackburnbacteria bacterium]